jgi:ribosome biogenesis GTPase
MNKKDKKKFKRKNIRLKNVSLDDINNFEDEEVVEEKRAAQKSLEKGEKSSKSDLNLKLARVIEVLSNNRCLVKYSDQTISCVIGGRLKQISHNTRSILAVGDLVHINLANKNRVEEILPRQNSLSRFTEDSFQREVIIAANIDQVVITAAFSEPEFSIGLIDRYLCAAHISQINPIICINKSDLATSKQRSDLQFYCDCGYQVIFTSAENQLGISELRNILQGKKTVFSGKSGVGKSSLINALQPNFNLKVSDVSDYSGKGRHTTTSARLLEWSFGGFLVDTPGIKTFTLHSGNKHSLAEVFPGFSELRKKCKFMNCSHTHEVDCAVKKAVEKENYPVAHYQSYLRLMESL